MSEPEEGYGLGVQSNPLLDLDDDKPLLCPYQQAGMQDGEICEACQ